MRFLIVTALAACLCVSSAFAQPQYFGFYDCDAGCMDQVHTFANVAVIRIHAADPAADVAQIQHAHSLGLKVVLSYFPDYLQELFDRNAPWQQKQWTNWTKAIKPHTDDIVAIYPYDEPYLGAINKVGRLRDVPRGQQKQIVGYTKAKLEMAKGRIRTSFPGMPLIYNEAFVMVNDELEPPADYNWIGFDCYRDFDDCQGKSIPEYYRTLASRATKGQKFIAVIPGFIQVRTNANVSQADASRLGKQLEKYANFVRSDPRFVAVLAWTYQVYPQKDGTEYRGLKGLPSLAGEYQRFAREIGVK